MMKTTSKQAVRLNESRLWASPLYCSRHRGLFISTVKKSRDPLSRAATILRRKRENTGDEVESCKDKVRLVLTLKTERTVLCLRVCVCVFHLLLRKARAVIPETPSSLLQRNEPSTASHNCNKHTSSLSSTGLSYSVCNIVFILVCFMFYTEAFQTLKHSLTSTTCFTSLYLNFKW